MKKQAVMILCISLLVGLLAGCNGVCQTKSSNAVQKKMVIYNLDDSVYFGGALGACTPDGVDSFAQGHAAAGVTDMFVNVNAQRTNYRSSVWEAYWDGPNDNNAKQFKVFEEQGLDYIKVMIDSSRKAKMKAWLSVRMNDAHDPAFPESPYHSNYWRNHPEWYVGPNKCLDFGQAEVRDYYMKLIKELCNRYDMDGIELDYLRFSDYFKEGNEHEGAKLMTAFVTEVHNTIEKAAKRQGHPIKLAVRVERTPWVALRYSGLDAVAWAKSGLIDVIIASPSWASIDPDIPIETWKGMLIGTNVKVVYGIEDGIMGDGQMRRCPSIDEMRGCMLSALSRGADGVYYFNLYGVPFAVWPREDYFKVMKESLNWKALTTQQRRHPVSRATEWALGEPGLQNPLAANGSHGSYRIHIGPKPLPNQSVWVELSSPGNDTAPEVKVNGIPVKLSGINNSEHLPKLVDWEKANLPPENIYTKKRYVYSVPLSAINQGYNLVEVISEQPIKVSWLEINIK